MVWYCCAEGVINVQGRKFQLAYSPALSPSYSYSLHCQSWTAGLIGRNDIPPALWKRGCRGLAEALSAQTSAVLIQAPVKLPLCPGLPRSLQGQEAL